MKLFQRLKSLNLVMFLMLLAMFFEAKAQENCSLNVVGTDVLYVGGANFEISVEIEAENGFFEVSSSDTVYTECFDAKRQERFTFFLSCDDSSDYIININEISITNGSCNNPSNSIDCSTVVSGDFPSQLEKELRCIQSTNDFEQNFRLANTRVSGLDFPIRSGRTKRVTANSCLETEITFDFEVRGGCYDFSENPGILDLNNYLFEPGDEAGTWRAAEASAPIINENGIVDFQGAVFGTYTYIYYGNSLFGECGEIDTNVIINYFEDAQITPIQTNVVEICDNEELTLESLSSLIDFEPEEGLWIPNRIQGDGLYYFYTPNDVEEYINDINAYCNMDIYAFDVKIDESEIYYIDNDSDTYGVDDPNTNITSCEPLSGYTTRAGDCDDTNSNANPNAEDIPNDGIDQDCDGDDAYTCVLQITGEDVFFEGGNEYSVTVFFESTNGIIRATDDFSSEKIIEFCIDNSESGVSSNSVTFNYSCDDSYEIKLSIVPSTDDNCQTPINPSECKDSVSGNRPSVVEPIIRCIKSVDDFDPFSFGDNLRVARLEFPVRSGGKKIVTANSCVSYEITADYDVRGGCYYFTENPGILDLNDYLFEPGDGMGEWTSNEASFPSISEDGIIDLTGFGFGNYTYSYTGNSALGECGESSTEVLISYSETPDRIPVATNTITVCETDNLSIEDLATQIGFDISDGLWIPSTITSSGQYKFYTPNNIFDFIESTDSNCEVDVYVFNVTINPLQTYYVDNDSDGYGVNDVNTNIDSCETLSGYSLIAGDCDDTDLNVNPEATEISDDGIDQDCDGEDLITPTEFSGCTHGYWKNHNNWCDDYDKDMNFFEVFGITDYDIRLNKYASFTLLDGLRARGGGHAKLMRNAVAALLNICSSEINYSYDYNTLVMDVRRGFKARSKKIVNPISNKYGRANSLNCIFSNDNDIDRKNDRSLAIKIRAYPNPIRNKNLNIRFSSNRINGVYKATIYNLYGLEIADNKFSLNQSGDEFNWRLNTNKWDSGIFILELIGPNNNRKRIKLVKE